MRQHEGLAGVDAKDIKSIELLLSRRLHGNLCSFTASPLSNPGLLIVT
jgi:hypothetical protein